jgi:hypothetical protein
VLLVTDGLEHGDTQALTFEMERLHKSCRRLIWLNPLLRFDQFEPRAGGIKAMLPHKPAVFLPLNLASLASEHARVKAVVGLGEAGPEVVAAFAAYCPTALASTMADAVELAADFAAAGDVVLLSPACASFDWYPGGGYPARGDDFKRLVAQLDKEHA